MNRKMVWYTIGRIVWLEGVLLLLPLAVSLLYREYACAAAFGVTIGVAAVIGAPLALLRTKNRVIYAREGFTIVAVAWIVMSVIGALPFVISGQIPSYIDAFFETVSGLTTTGSSILHHVDRLGHGIAFWRSFTHWIGGMGVLVLMMAVLPTDSGRSMHIMRAEMPGPVVGKLVPRIRDTAKILYLIYIGLTVLETVLLLCGGMPLFDSLIHAMGTAGTGGFGIKPDSLAGYSPYLQWVVTVFMLLFGVNFNLYFLLLIGRVKSFFKSRELWCYVGIFLAAATLITANIYRLYPTVGESVRQAAFQTSSILTTTGYATADFNRWPLLSQAILFLLMFIGGCAGSTAGGLKVSRVILLFKMIRREFKRMLHPNAVGSVQLEGKALDTVTLHSVATYFALFILCQVVIFLSLCILNSFDLTTNLTATAATFNNIGPGLAGVGPAANYAAFSPVSKLILSASMLLGRLEIYPLLLTFSPSVWRKK
ncbi:MAG: TrkH family potassium uptake protein [Acutalibacteraceae bacterium]|jgi:trk system potassium uptake protein TrkH